MQPEQPVNTDENVPNSDVPTEMYTPEVANNETEPASAQTPGPEIMPNTPTISEPIHWSANEYIHQEKNGLWYVIFAIVVLAFIVADIYWIKSFLFSFSILIVVMAAAVIMFARRPPRTIDYTLSGDQGLYIGEKLYHFSEFKAFGLIRDQGEHSIVLIPIKRFSPGITVYFPEESGEQIVDIFGARLPMQELKLDAIDVVVRKLRL